VGPDGYINPYDNVRNTSLSAEFRCLTNGLLLEHGKSLLGALAHYNLEAMQAGEKEYWQKLAENGGPRTADEWEGLLQYCAQDVDAEVRLFLHLAPRIPLSQALVRGHYTKTVAQVEATGIPIDQPLYHTILEQWEPLKQALITRKNPDFGCPYDAEGHFRHAALLRWADTQGIAWPRTTKGLAVLEKEDLKDLALLYPQLEPFRQLRKTLGQMRATGFPVGADGRNRFLLWPFGTKTGRNAPGTSANIMGTAAWLRFLIQAPEGYGLAYVDWAQQEYGIAAALSHDKGMQLAYLSGDPYIALARMARAVPVWATKDSHGKVRDRYKTVSLGVLYGMRGPSLARRLDLSLGEGEQLLADHEQAFPTYWAWNKETVLHALLARRMSTVLGWHLHCGPWAEQNKRSISNFPMQGNGSEMLKLASCLTLEAGVTICALVHDALLILAPLADLPDAIATTQRCMAEASRYILKGFELASEVHIFTHPYHYFDKRGVDMWKEVRDILGQQLFLA
jgi:DNA polymerase I-like protein with 3'-5' exonuclease and polymerase domains